MLVPISFALLALLALGGALMLLFRRDPVDGVLSLVVTMLALAGIYLQLADPVVAALQVIVYAGAIMVLFLFVTMFVRRAEERGPLGWDRPRFALASIVAACLLGLLVQAIGAFGGNTPTHPGPPAEIAAIAHSLFGEFLYPFELVSALLLVAMVGVVVLGRRGEESS
ncbi:MAG: NADH-quinone oxidoreductase subunit J [Gemmatimonadetes bacterium]|nr:NADH-quinone oxidoreductase subunit J [Gemmatimonadota bacterium]